MRQKTIYLVPCSSRQSNIDIEDYREARFCYLGPQFKNAYKKANNLKKNGDKVFILSSDITKALLAPKEKIKPYNVDPNTWINDEKKCVEWIAEVIKKLEKNKCDLLTDNFIAIGCWRFYQLLKKSKRINIKYIKIK